MTLQSIFEWFLSNIAWTLLVAVCFTIPIVCFRSVQIARSLLRKNRYTKGNGCGQHKADRFIDIHFSNTYAPISYGILNNSIASTKDHWIDIRIVDDRLIELGLITRAQDNRLTSIITWRNKLILFLIKNYLIFFIGDSKSYYNDLSDHRKKDNNKSLPD